jgi:hypothetical protein
VASAIRSVDGDTNGAPALSDWLRKMGEPLYLNAAPTGYSEESGAWMNTGVFLNRINFGLALTRNQIPGTVYDSTKLVTPEMTANLNELTDRLTALVLHADLSPDGRRTIRAGLEKMQDRQPAAAVRVASAPEGRPSAAPRATTQKWIPAARGVWLRFWNCCSALQSFNAVESDPQITRINTNFSSLS